MKYALILMMFMSGCSIKDMVKEDSTCKASVDLECTCKCDDAEDSTFKIKE